MKNIICAHAIRMQQNKINLIKSVLEHSPEQFTNKKINKLRIERLKAEVKKLSFLKKELSKRTNKSASFFDREISIAKTTAILKNSGINFFVKDQKIFI